MRAVNLRDYQHNLIDGIRTELRTGAKSVLVQLSTGGGKTVIFAHLCSRFCAAGQDAWVLVHRVELAAQARAKLDAYGCDSTVAVSMITTISKRLGIITEWPRWVIVDEAHHAASATWARVITACQEHGASVIGFSATPERLDGRGLQMFDRLICGPPTRELQDAGHLARARYFCPPTLQVSDWRESAIEAAARDAKVTGDAVATWRQKASGLATIVFCTSLAHCADVTEAATLAGISAASIDGTMQSQERAALIARLADGSLSWLVSCELISEGLDVPSCKCVVMLRPTQSLALHLQQIGRALRPGGTAIVLDHVGNCERLGMAETLRDWSLDGKAKSRTPKLLLRRCEKCFAAWTGAKLTCPECGHVAAPAKGKKRAKNEDGELVEVEPPEKMPLPPATLKLLRGMFARKLLWEHRAGGLCFDWPVRLSAEESCQRLKIPLQPVAAKCVQAFDGRLTACAYQVTHAQ